VTPAARTAAQLTAEAEQSRHNVSWPLCAHLPTQQACGPTFLAIQKIGAAPSRRIFVPENATRNRLPSWRAPKISICCVKLNLGYHRRPEAHSLLRGQPAGGREHIIRTMDSPRRPQPRHHSLAILTTGNLVMPLLMQEQQSYVPGVRPAPNPALSTNTKSPFADSSRDSARTRTTGRCCKPPSCACDFCRRAIDSGSGAAIPPTLRIKIHNFYGFVRNRRHHYDAPAQRRSRP